MSKPLVSCGVLCGADRSIEWMLPWWWSRYREHNDFPVAFCDFGMSCEAKKWCCQRGELLEIAFDPQVVTPREQIAPELADAWEAMYGKSIWEARKAWFQKPFAFLATPYQRTIWIDLDCEILAPLEELFKYCHPVSELGIVREFRDAHLPRFHLESRYNSGVVVFEQGAKLIHTWAQAALVDNHRFWGDDPLLSHLINASQVDVAEIPEMWNWRISQGFSIAIAILHWTGVGGKGLIREKGGLKPALDLFYKIIRRDFKPTPEIY
jgi:hypothetical protein